MATDQMNCNTCRHIMTRSTDNPCKQCKFSGFGLHEGQEPTEWEPLEWKPDEKAN